MKFASTIIVWIIALAGLAALLRANGQGWSLAWSHRGGHATTSSRLIPPSRLPVDDVTRISLKRANEPTLVFERSSAGTWSQTQPFTYPMDPYSVRQLAAQAAELTLIDTIGPEELRSGVSLSDLSLSPCAAEMKYEWPAGSLTLNLGRRGVAGRAYLQIAGDQNIYIVGQKLHERAVEMDPKEWRNRTIFPGAGVESSRIEWTYGNGKLVLARERKQWTMLEPVRTRIDAAARDQLMDGIGRAVVSGFILDQPAPTDLSKFGLNEPAATLSIATPEQGGGNTTTQKLIIGGRAGGATQDYFAMIEGRPTVVRLSGAVIAAIFKRPQDLAALTASGVNPADVKSIVIRAAGSADELKLERDLEKWRIPALDNAEVKPVRVQELLEQLTQLRALSVELRDYPRDLEAATITLYGYDSKAIDTVRVIHESETGRWGMENGDNVLRMYPPSLKLRLTAADFGVTEPSP